MSKSKKLCQPVTVIKHGKTCNEKNREFASATIATLVELNILTKMSKSKKLCQPVTVIKHGKTCNEKNRITDRHIKRHDSRKKK